MVFPYGAVIVATSMMRRNNEEYERQKSAQKKFHDTKIVKDIIVTYDDGSCRTVKHGIAAEAISDEQILLDYANCTDEHYFTILSALVQLGKEKGIIK